MVEPQPSKLIMPVRSRSAALFRRAAQEGRGGSAAKYAFLVIPRISRGRIRLRRRVSPFGETREGLGDHRSLYAALKGALRTPAALNRCLLPGYETAHVRHFVAMPMTASNRDT